MKKSIRYFIMIISLSIITYGSASTYEQKYILMEYKSLHEKFDSVISETGTMDWDSLTNSMIYEFKTDNGYNLVSTVIILVVALYLMAHLIGIPSHGIGFSDTIVYASVFDKEKANEIDAQPMHLGKAVIVFIAALYLIHYLNSGYVNKTFDFNKKKLYLTNNQNNDLVQSYNLDDIKNIELLKLIDTNYEHYELNIHLMNGKRIHIFARKDDLLTVPYAELLANKMNKPIEKILVSLE